MIRRRKPLRRSGRIRPVSKKREQEWRVYSVKRAAFLQAHPICQAVISNTNLCTLPATDVHHKAGRSGHNYLAETTWMAVCRNCHMEIEGHKSWARRMGYITY